MIRWQTFGIRYNKIPEYDPVLKKQEESVYRDIIAIYDPDRKSMRQLDRMINKALPNYKIEYFEAVQDLIEFVKDTDVTIAFMNIDSLMPLINLQQIVFRLCHKSFLSFSTASAVFFILGVLGEISPDKHRDKVPFLRNVAHITVLAN